MLQYLIEREAPGAGKMSEQQLQEVSATSMSVLRDLGPDIRWLHSYVTDDKIYCVYETHDPALIKQHAERGGFRCDRIERVQAVISPATAEMKV